VDIRQYGDKNPGAANVYRASGWRLAFPALLLDGLKGALPVGLAWFWGFISGWQIVPVALAAILGHAYTPWLGGRGGKAIAVTFGVWAGLTAGAGPTILGMLLGIMFCALASSGWAVAAAMSCFGIFIARQYGSAQPAFLMIWLGNMLLLLWKYRDDLRLPPRVRRWKILSREMSREKSVNGKRL